MSGGGGGGGFIGGGPGDEISCERLRFDAQLTSPQPDIVEQLSVNEVLAVVLGNTNGVIVVQVLKDGHPAGGLVGPDATRLRTCLTNGHQFQAIVRSITGGQVRVHVTHA